MPIKELLDYFRYHRSPPCSLSPIKAGHVKVTCGQCQVIIFVEEDMTTTSANDIERLLEPCLGPNWMS